MAAGRHGEGANVTARKPSSVGLIPARSGSKRIVHKNIRPLAGHPLITYTIRAALDSGVFDAVVVSTDSDSYAAIARHYRAEVPFPHPAEMAADQSPDIEWVRHALETLAEASRDFEVFSILRPTSPFRLPATIQRAWGEFIDRDGIDSIRAVEPCGQHPGKMWEARDGLITPIMPHTLNGQPWHSNQYAALPEILVQNASLEIAWSRVVLEGGTISGAVIAPFRTEGVEGLDVNTEPDWWYAQYLLERGEAKLPKIGMPAPHG
jgi:N-acylneuraminate cytidylyltransferase